MLNYDHTDKLIAQLKAISKTGIEVGVFKSEIAPRYFFNELGTKNIPERPTLRPVFDSRMVRSKVRKLLAKGFELKGLSFLDIPGKFLKKAVKDKIKSSVPPPNKASTIARKGHGKTLIDTGELLKSIEYKLL